ncbi:MAG: flagellar export chaperone FliS [Oscillospiraceae bacterium]|jgi:flagellar protein FliS|nr:flagellar export chaperone FliS [Oscillospiraceae bacterium]
MYSPYNEYKRQSVMTMTQGDMIVKLYDECIADMTLALESFQEEDPGVRASTRVSMLRKASDIIRYLRSILNMDIEISQSLSDLYDFFLTHLLDANRKVIKEPIEDVVEMMSELRSSFFEANNRPVSKQMPNSVFSQAFS